MLCQKTYRDDQYHRHFNQGELAQYLIEDHHKGITTIMTLIKSKIDWNKSHKNGTLSPEITNTSNTTYSPWNSFVIIAVLRSNDRHGQIKSAGLDYLESMLNMEGTNQHEVEQLAGLIAGMKELSAKNAKLLANIWH